MKTLNRSLVIACCAAVLVTVAVPTHAQSNADMLQKAESSCIEKAAAEGYDPARAEVISSETVDADTVKVVLNLTKDGTNFARLTCPFSATRGVVSFGEDVANAAPQANLTRFWWLLLPLIALPLLLWFLSRRNRQEYVPADRVRTTERSREYVTADRIQSQAYTEAHVNTLGEMLEVREYPNTSSRVLRRLNHGEHITLTGQQDQEWVELVSGGWVPSRSLRFSNLPRTYS